MITFQNISDIFWNFLNSNSVHMNHVDDLSHLIKSSIEVNQRQWNLEDITRMKELGFESVALAKQEIDKSNQIRNDLIQKMDVEIEKILDNDPLGPKEKFYAESPGMIIDRLAILSIKLSVIRKITVLITDKHLKAEYLGKEKDVSEQINEIGTFLDSYFFKIRKGEVFFKVQKSIKIYNDKGVRTYIKNLMEQSI